MDRIMVFAPHMDDEVIGCGGSLLKHLQNNCSVHIVYFTDGSYLLENEVLRNKYMTQRIAEVELVCGSLGATYTTLNIPDRQLSYNNVVLKQLMQEIRHFQPDIIYLPHSSENDREHRIVHELVTQAIWLGYSTHDIECEEKCRRASFILEYEVWTPLQSVDYVNNITDFVSRKDELVCLYKSQLGKIKYNEAALSLNRYRGIMHLHTDSYGEAFKINKLSNSVLSSFLG